MLAGSAKLSMATEHTKGVLEKRETMKRKGLRIPEVLTPSEQKRNYSHNLIYDILPAHVTAP